MASKRSKVLEKLDQLNESIERLEEDLFERSNNLEPNESQSVTKKLEIMRQIYQLHQQYPAWPYNSATLKQLFLLILLPAIVGLLTLLLKQLFNNWLGVHFGFNLGS